MFAWCGYKVYYAVTAEPGPPIDTFAKLIELSESVQPADGESAWPICIEAIEVLNSVDLESIPGWPTDDSGRVYDLQRFFQWIESGTTEEDDAIMRAMQAVYENAGFFDLTAKLSAAPRAIRPYEVWNESILEYDLTELQDSRRLDMSLVGRMHMSALEGDEQTMVESFEQALALGRVLLCQPFLIHSLVGSAVNSRAQSMLMHLLREYQFDEELCTQLLDAMARRESQATVVMGIQSERPSLLDIIHRVYSDDGHGDGIFLPVALAKLDPSVSQRMSEQSSLNLASLFLPSAAKSPGQ